ncbi:tumor necrosis factor ligand superfamily member 14 [Nothobranchius furzeri]|uniref:tumor necrosis factor ligand superfamily member 14 n=1 Tax=Nothobranchius furzeri TaxID=105023 RepID=UPI003904C17D
MSEVRAGAPPQVFVVDSQASYISMPTGKKQKWVIDGQKCFLLLLGLIVLGLFIEGFLIYKGHEKTESSRQVGSKVESNEIPAIPTSEQQRPFAHLLVSSNQTGLGNVVQWADVGEAKIQKMKYERGRLIVEQGGYYYLYSKVELNAGKECEVIFHRVMKETNAYGEPIELMKSKSNRCWRNKPHKSDDSEGEDLRNSFLAGIHRLEEEDNIFFVVDKIEKLNLGPYESFMGAFLVSQ